jgi:ferredoxin
VAGSIEEQSEAVATQPQVVLTGFEAVARVERAIARDAVARDPAVAEGLAMAGTRAASLSDGPGMRAADGIALPGASCVHHVHAAPGRRTGGAFELAAASAQQAADHCLAAHLLSQRLGRAGLCSLAPSLAESLNLVILPAPELIAELLESDPCDAEPEADAARILDLAREAIRAVGKHTARPGDLVEAWGDENPAILLVASGAQTWHAREAARLLSEAGAAVGVLSVVLVRPFPEAEVREALSGARVALVVEEPGEPGALFGSVRAVGAEKTKVQLVVAAGPGPVIEAAAGALPPGSIDREAIASAEAPRFPRRLAVIPAGPWGEETARRVLSELARELPIRVPESARPERGATVLAWGSAKHPGEGGDLLLAPHPELLDAEGALALLRPGSSVLMLSASKSSGELAQLLSPEVRELLGERGLRAHWVVPPTTTATGAPEERDRAASTSLVEAAVALVRRAVTADDEKAASLPIPEVEALHTLDPADLEKAPALPELDFRPATKLPRMPEAVDDPVERQRWRRWIQRFHRGSPASADPAPQLPVRPAVLASLAESLRGSSPHPFVLLPSQETAAAVSPMTETATAVSPMTESATAVSARGLRELLREGVGALVGAGGEHRPLVENLEPLAAIAARLLAEGEAGADLDDLLSQAGAELAQKLALPEGVRASFHEDMQALRRLLPGDGWVLDLRSGTPIQLYLKVVAAVRAPMRRSFAEQLGSLREGLRDLLQLDRMQSADGRGSHALAAELGSSATDYLDPGALARTLPESPGSAALDAQRRERIERALAAIEEHLNGGDPSPEVVLLRPPDLALGLPEAQQREHPDPMAAAVGFFEGTARRMAPVFRAARVARLEVEGRYRPELHDELLVDIDWQSFTAEELSLLPLVAVVTSGRHLRRHGQGSLSELLRSSRPVHVIVQDEVGAGDEAEELSAFHLDLGTLVMAHREVFVVSSTLARPDRLAAGVARMARAPRPAVAVVALPAPELGPWRALLAEADLSGRACPDFLYDPDAGESWADRFDLEGNPQPELAWPVHRIGYLEGEAEGEFEAALTFADAVALEPAYLSHLRVIPRAAWDDDVQLPLADYLERFDPEGRGRFIPYLWVVDDEKTLQRAVVTRELAMACRDRLRGWRVLQELAGFENAYAERAAAAAREQALDQAARERNELEQAHAEALETARNDGARESMEQLAARLMSPDGLGAAALFPAESAAPIPAPATAAVQEAAAPAQPEEEPEEQEALSFDEPYIDQPLCTTCNECTNINSRLFQYNSDKQAFIADPTEGTFADLVKAAELCPARCIHPGKPRSGDSTATPELLERAAPFN